MTAPLDPRIRPSGKAIFPDECFGPDVAALLLLEDEAAIGFRIVSPREDIASVAMKLASLGMEHDVEVVVLADGDYSGLERFGFRSEWICGETAEQHDDCLDQIRQFWGIDLIL